MVGWLNLSQNNNLSKEAEMFWSEIRKTYPNQWLVIEALTTPSNQRELDKIAAIEICTDGITAMKRYRALHSQFPEREFYFVKNWTSVNVNGWASGEIMRLRLKDSLPFVTLAGGHKGKTARITAVWVDTGSASTILAADYLAEIGIEPSPEDVLHTIRGVGGVEAVDLRRVNFLEVGERKVADFEIEVGGIDYGFEINGILGMDFLLTSGAIID
jgi:hypothetical protein